MKWFDQTACHLVLALHSVLIGAAIVSSSGCTSGDGVAARGGIEGTGDKVTAPISASGSVTGFGSIWVNGIRFDVSTAAVTRGDVTLSEQVIQPGMMVQVEGTIGADGVAYAKTVKLDDSLRGPITEIIQKGNPYSEIRMLGQTVIVPEEAVLMGLTTSSLKIGDHIIVNGLKGAEGSTVATRLEHAEAADTVKLEGLVKSIDAAQYQLLLGGSRVDYGNARFINGNASQLAAGQRLQVEAASPTMPTANPVLVATVIRFKEVITIRKVGSQHYEEGVIDSLTSLTSFVLNGITIDASQGDFRRGDITNVAPGVRVTVEGTMNTQGVLVAKTINILLPSETRYHGTVQTISLTARHITVLGTEFTVDSHTAYEDLSSRENRKINLSDFTNGDTVEVYGRKIGTQWYALRIRRLNPSNEQSSLRGPVGEILSPTQFYVTGVLVDASNVLDRELLNTLKAGQRVQVQGTLTGDKTMNATRINGLEHDHCPEAVLNSCDDDDEEESKDTDRRHHHR